jgi:hypothetical protein
VSAAMTGLGIAPLNELMRSPGFCDPAGSV